MKRRTKFDEDADPGCLPYVLPIVWILCDKMFMVPDVLCRDGRHSNYLEDLSG